MTVTFWAMTILIMVGVGIRIITWRGYLDGYARRYSSAPPRGWLWTNDADSEIERLRRRMVLGTVLTIVGLILLLVDTFS